MMRIFFMVSESNTPYSCARVQAQACRQITAAPASINCINEENLPPMKGSQSGDRQAKLAPAAVAWRMAPVNLAAIAS
jgi:hypothetical protein